MAYTTFNPNFPQYLLSVNVSKIKEAGLTVSDIMNAMQSYLADYISTILISLANSIVL